MFAVTTVVIFFVYPHLNEEKYEQIMSNIEQEESISDTDLEYIGGEFDYLNNELEQLREEERRLAGVIDSLTAVSEELNAEIEAQTVALQETTQAQDAGQGTGLLTANDENEEDFSERIKSLLNLDEHELAPIVNQMTQAELVRLYKGAGNIQREKLLRSLEPNQAAELMKEVML